ncbi:MAG: hypothetical protein FGM24_00760 [Candidatus Kapabacteria bacterium]|nr:hypothetical protein [Candidatus Kapabacteria bacterium]
MIDVFLQLSIPLACGVLYRFLPDTLAVADVRRVIGSIVLNVFIPLLTFGVLSRVHSGEHIWTVPIVSVLTVLVGLALSWLVYAVGLRHRLPAASIGALILAGTWCNAMYLGLPITTAVLGEGARHIPIEYDYLGMTPLLFSVGSLICVRFGTGNEQASLGDAVRQVLRLPPMIAIAIAMLVNIIDIPIAPWITASCLAAGKIVPQLMLFSIGLTLRVPELRRVPIILPAVLIRTMIVPVIIWFVATWLIDDKMLETAVMLETAMPTMMLTMVFAERYGLDTDVLAQAILGSTLVSLMTLPFLVSLM